MSDTSDRPVDPTTSRPTTPDLEGPMAHESTLEDLEIKMKDLELRVLGRELPPPEASPFTPHSTLESRIQRLKESLKGPKSVVSAKLPPIPLPEFDGTTWKSF